MTGRKIFTRAAVVVALVTTGALITGVGLVAAPVGASPHAVAHVRHAAGDVGLADLALTTSYDCVGPCAAATYFSASGVARSGVTTYGWSETGAVTSVEKNGCLVSSIHEALEAQSGADSGDAIYFSTTKDLECPTANPNVYSETAPLTVSGGTGAFKSATGEGSVSLTVLNSPQIGWGAFTASVSY